MKKSIWILVFLISHSALGRIKADSKSDKKLQELITLSQSGDYKPPLQKNDLFCNGQKISSDSKLSPQDKSKLCKMTIEEFQALHNYTIEENIVLNAVLRKKEKSTIASKNKILNLKNALKKIDSLAALTLRQTELPLSEAKKHVIGKIVYYPGFTSTSLDLNYERNMSYTFFIYVKNCKYISALSNITSEQEVLCAPGSHFKVMAYSKKNDHHYYLMEQVK
jgi:ADP-ribosyltransferase exoenzyme